MNRIRLTMIALIMLCVASIGGGAGMPTAAAQAPQGLGFALEVNFQPSKSWLPSGYLSDPSKKPDIGLVYGDRRDGYTFGWNADNSANMRDRDVYAPDATVFNSPRQREDTLVHMQRNGTFTWEAAVPSAGVYLVELYAADPSYTDTFYDISVEGQRAMYRSATENASPETNIAVEVTDGRLTITPGPDGQNVKLNWVRITKLFSAKVNFQPANTPLVDGYLPDTGATYGLRANGYTYGWQTDNSANMRDRNLADDQRYDTVALTQLYGENTWEIEVPQGQYTVRVVAGDPAYIDSVYDVAAEYETVVSGTPTDGERWFEGTATFVQIFAQDGRLTIFNGEGAQNNKIVFIEITQTGIGR